MPWVPHALRPAWDRRFPGRLAWELDHLAEHATDLVINQTKLAEGTLEVDFNWPVREGVVPLRATYPTTFPYMRPHVQLLTDPSTWPTRHISPKEGGLCLLGRDTTQWSPGDWLADVLATQLETALHGTGGAAEDPQGEPAEYWWNQLGLHQSYCLVDSGWEFGEAAGGTLNVRIHMDPPRAREAGNPQRLPAFRMVVTEVLDNAGRHLAQWLGPLPPELQDARRLSIRWCRVDETLLPVADYHVKIQSIREACFKGPGAHTTLGHDVAIRPFVILHPVELTETRVGDGWLVGVEWGSLRAFLPARTGARHLPIHSAIVPVYRAGVSDLGSRVPAFHAAAGKTVAIVGVGALGAPLALELARNGAAALRLLDHDVVEPGNSVRWPLGVASWGHPKVDALKAHLNRHYPRCEVLPIRHAIGGLGAPDSVVLGPLVQGAHLVVDASASEGVNRAVWDLCDQAEVTLVKLGATPSVKGGTVAVFVPGGPCPTCLHIARYHGRLQRPAGEADVSMVQPPGCGERTFVGADYDLQELSLQAMRCAIAALEQPPAEAVIFTLSLVDADDVRVAPVWVRETLAIQPECDGHC